MLSAVEKHTCSYSLTQGSISCSECVIQSCRTWDRALYEMSSCNVEYTWWYMLNDVRNNDYVDKLWLYRWTINIAEIFCMFIPSLVPDPIWERDWFIPCKPHISLHYISVWTDKMNARWTCYTNLVKGRPTQVTSCSNSCSHADSEAGRRSFNYSFIL